LKPVYAEGLQYLSVPTSEVGMTDDILTSP